MQEQMSALQYETYQAIKRYWKEYGHAPTVLNIAEMLDKSYTATEAQVKHLENGGWVEKVGRRGLYVRREA